MKVYKSREEKTRALRVSRYGQTVTTRRAVAKDEAINDYGSIRIARAFNQTRRVSRDRSPESRGPT